MNNKLVITKDKSNTIYSCKFDDIYHSKHGSIDEANHVFIKHGLFASKKKKLNILEVGFGTGLNALLTLIEAKKKLIKINYHAVELYPLPWITLKNLNFCNLINIDNKIFEKLHLNWNEAIIMNDYFTIVKYHTSVEKYFNKKIKYDIIYFDAFSPSKQADIWEENILSRMYNILKENSFLVTYCAKGIIKRRLKKIGFDVICLQGPPGKREMIKAIKSNQK